MPQPKVSAFVLRLPTPLKLQVQRIAGQNRRSMTREIQVAIEKHVAPPSETKPTLEEQR